MPLQVCVECGKTAYVNNEYVCDDCARSPSSTVMKVFFDNSGNFVGRLVAVDWK